MMLSCLWLLTLSLGVQAFLLASRLGAAGNETLTEQAPFLPSPGLKKDRVLVFVPVCKKSMKLMTSNIDHLRTFEAVVSVDVFLAHYDGDRDSWVQALGPWYRRNVQFHAQLPGLKMWLAKDLLLASHSQVQIDSYSYVWLLDEDAGLATLDVTRMLELVHESKANIVTPAFVNACWECAQSEAQRVSTAKAAAGTDVRGAGGVFCQTGELMCEFQSPRSACRYRYTNFVEVSFPLIKPAALRRVLGACGRCMPNRHSTWGLNRVWCLAAATDSDVRGRSCAIIDGTPILHYNLRTHPKSGNGTESVRAQIANWNALDRVQRTFPAAAYAGQFRTYQCIPR